ncbi:hypothetical protein [Rahnella sp. EDr1-12]
MSPAHKNQRLSGSIRRNTPDFIPAHAHSFGLSDILSGHSPQRLAGII